MSFSTSRMPHVRSSSQPSQRRYAVWLRHGTGASGPSKMRMMLARLMSSGRRRKRYPPPRPLRLSRMPCCFSSRRISSKNFLGMPSRSAMSAISIGSLWSTDASKAKALSAYFVFIVSMASVEVTYLLDRLSLSTNFNEASRKVGVNLVCRVRTRSIPRGHVVLTHEQAATGNVGRAQVCNVVIEAVFHGRRVHGTGREVTRGSAARFVRRRPELLFHLPDD